MQRWDLHHRWTMSLLDEFFLQGDKERELGLPFSPLCDRNNTLVAESQIGFIDFIVEPSMGVCADMLECILGPLHSSTKNSTSSSGQEPISEENTGKFCLDLHTAFTGTLSLINKNILFRLELVVPDIYTFN